MSNIENIKRLLDVLHDVANPPAGDSWVTIVSAVNKGLKDHGLTYSDLVSARDFVNRWAAAEKK